MNFPFATLSHLTEAEVVPFPSFHVIFPFCHTSFSSGPQVVILSGLGTSSIIAHSGKTSFPHGFSWEHLTTASFRCQHKGRCSWDTHPSWVTCRIREKILCSCQEPCPFGVTLGESDWISPDMPATKINSMPPQPSL